MPISQEDFDLLQENMEKLETALYEIENIVKSADEHLYEQWKAYGKAVTSEFVSMGPSLPEVIEKLEQDITSDEDEEEPEAEAA
jgi:hypothetical protein